MLKTLLRILITSQLQQTSYLYTWVLDCVTSVSFSPQPHCQFFSISLPSTATAAKSLQSCPTLSDSMDCSPPGSSVPGILQARILEWVATAFSNAWKWKVKVSLFSHVRLLVTHGPQPTSLLHPSDFPGKRTGVGCHRLLLVNAKANAYLTSKSKKKKKIHNLSTCQTLSPDIEEATEPNRTFIITDIYFPFMIMEIFFPLNLHFP